MSQERAAVVGANAWPDDVARLLEKPSEPWQDGIQRPLGRKIAGLLLRDGAAASTELRNQVIFHALAHGDTRGDPLDEEARALREHVRGFFWLPASGSDWDSSRVSPPMADMALVTNGGKWIPTQVGQRRRWGMVRYWRVKGEDHKHTSPEDALNIGNRLKVALAQRLSDDLDAFFEDEDALEQFAPDIHREVVHERYTSSRRTSRSLQRRLQEVAASLGRLSPLYPPHLTVEDLVAGRSVALLSRKIDDGDEKGWGFAPTSSDTTVVGTPALTTLASLRRAVLLGDPGSGKSTLGRAMVIESVASESGGVAVYVRASSLARALQSARGFWLDAVAQVALTLRLSAPTLEDVDELSRLLRTDRTVLVVIDGIDEVFDPSERTLLSEVIDGFVTLPGRVVITSRLTGYRHQHGWTDVAALPLQSGDFVGLLKRWYGEDKYNAVWQSILLVFGVEKHEEFVGHPVLAGIVALLAGEPESLKATSRPALYRQAVAHLCQRRWKAPEHDERSQAEVVALLAGYEQAAWEMAAVTTETSYSIVAESGIDAELLRTGELLQSSALDSDADIDQPWTWIHSSFADYLVSVRLQRLLRTDLEEARQALRRAVQYEEGWIESLMFLLEASTPRERAWIAAEWQTFAAEGDPGGIVAYTARRALADYQAEVGRFGDDLDFLRILVAEAEIEAQQATDAQRSACHLLERILAGEHSEALLRRPILDLRGGGDDLALVGAYWAAFKSQAFPDNLPLAFALGDALFEKRDSNPTDDSQLAAWLVASCRSGTSSEQARRFRPDERLLEDVRQGRFGDWGVLSLALREPDRVRRDSGNGCADLGRLIAPAEVDIVRHADPVAICAVLDGFKPEDALDPGRSEQLLRAVRSINGLFLRAVSDLNDHSADDLLEALVLLSDRLGGTIPWRRYELVATRPEDLARLVRGAVTRQLESLHSARLLQAALRCVRTGRAVRPCAIPPPAEHLVDIRDKGGGDAAMEILDWILGADPGALDSYTSFVSFTHDEQFAVAVLRRVGPRLVQGSGLYLDLVAVLNRAGLLAEWRDHLLSLPSGPHRRSGAAVIY